eukprot:543825-Pelagomonas_calceolata.AAC.1
MAFTHFCLAKVTVVFSRVGYKPRGRRLRLRFTKLVTAKVPARPVVPVSIRNAPATLGCWEILD